MTQTVELEKSLKALRLSGMLDTLEARLIQANNGDFGYLEFLQALCEDELNRRLSTSINRNIKLAHFETVSTLEEYDFNYNSKTPVAAIRDLATLRFLDKGESVIIHGPVGVGKTHLAQALGHLACRRGYKTIFMKTSKLLSNLAGGHADHSFDARIKSFQKPNILIFDDFAMRQFTNSQSDDLYELISERKDKSNIFTSNRAPSDWYQLFPNPVVAESLLDRIINKSHKIEIEGKSYRSMNQPKLQKEET